jgi:hypothetical protein
MGPHSGKGSRELGLVRSLGAAFPPRDVMLADAFYCKRWNIAEKRLVEKMDLNRWTGKLTEVAVCSRH